jgi:hypothetical protein
VEGKAKLEVLEDSEAPKEEVEPILEAVMVEEVNLKVAEWVEEANYLKKVGWDYSKGSNFTNLVEEASIRYLHLYCCCQYLPMSYLGKALTKVCC